MVKTLTALALLLTLATSALAQNWSGIVASSRAARWQPGVFGGSGVAGGIPSRKITCATLSPGVTALQISNAISSCPSGEVVFLSAGTYNISSPIIFNEISNVTLRGAGDMQTKVVLTGSMTGGGCITGYAEICITGVGNGPVNSSPLKIIGGLLQSSTSITLSSVSGLAVGQILVLDQCNSGLSGYTTGTGRNGGGDTCATGTEAWQWPNVTVCSVITTCSQEGPASGDTRLNLRNQEQLVKITSIRGATVNFTPGLYMPNWSTGQSAEAWTWGATASFDGLENMTIDYSRCSGCYDGVGMFNTDECWVKGMRFIGPASRNNIWLYGTYGTEVRDNYFWGSNGASESYGVELFWGSNSYIVNNILHHVVVPVLIGFSMGNVIAFNYTYDQLRNDFPDATSGFVHNHDGGGAYNLIEGNEGMSLQQDNFHGNENFQTYFRNLATGNDTTDFPNLGQCVIPFSDWGLNEFNNVIGNVFGQASWAEVHQVVEPSQTLINHSIYTLGQGNACGTPLTSLDDPNVQTSIMRWGNYDTINDSNQFNSSEVPSGLTDYANPVPSNKNLPPSFFLNASPPFWSTPYGTPPWPAVGPDVTGGPGPGGHSYSIPAALCYTHSPIDSAYQQSYSVTSAAFASGSPGTITFTIGRNSLSGASEITVTGVNPPRYNGTYSIASVTSTTVTVDVRTTLGTYVSGGTITYPNIRVFNPSICYPGDFPQPFAIRQIGTSTSAQVVIAWNYSPASTDCFVAAALDNGSGMNLTPLAYDVDTTKFPGANDQQRRFASLQKGAYRKFVLGTVPTPGDPYPAEASNGQYYSRSLQQDSVYNVQVTCGSSVATTQVHTAQLLPSIAYHPLGPILPGTNYPTPTPTLAMGSSLIDPNRSVR